ncbi:Uncharacterized protein TCAP_00772 [Tolypocladium capitatum]|uniref:FAM192A/Fyv6 N-terminal domain-containing protein n=1 Tax=Tolypocladium capitatum TaxID=45235 RepID=A0A2K3QP57_9HYPO|nr:Uncharacterized protein TCAP_00772 [Tolypocladium capitatum]
MASRFVSGGTISSSGEVSKGETAATSQPLLGKSAEWEVAQQELEAERKRRDEARLKAVAGEEKSLYDVLQANKAAKQAAVEEQNKLKNQFRALDNDEVEFLDEVRERERREEERVRRETEDGLRAFRERQKGGGGSGSGSGSEAVLEVGGRPEEEEEQWGVGRKRKRGGRERDVKGVRRKVSDAVEVRDAGHDDKEAKKPEQVAETPKEKKASVLVDYGSDSDD